MNRLLASRLGVLLAFAVTRSTWGAELPAPAGGAAGLAFTKAENGAFNFNTGLLRGVLRPEGKALGLTTVIHVPSGKRLDRSNGWFGHYRVFTKGARYGGGAWDWPSTATLHEDGAVEVHWPGRPERPFQMRALFRWRGVDRLDLETTFTAEKDLIGFESFLASYLSESFTNAAVFVAASPETKQQPAFLRIMPAAGHWQIFPRDTAVQSLIQDGRWQMEPNPVPWTLRPRLDRPLCFRRDPVSGLTVALMSPASDCFAIGSPEETEDHYSLYLSLFGRDFKAGETAVARARLVVSTGGSDQQVLHLYDEYLSDLHGSRQGKEPLIWGLRTH
jgi:hypothetical protein